jgi:hypothetical protein
MSIQFSCADCGAKYAVKAELAGKTAKCKCGAKIKIPAAVTSVQAKPTTKPSSSSKPTVSTKPVIAPTKTAKPSPPSPLEDMFDELPAPGSKHTSVDPKDKRADERSPSAEFVDRTPPNDPAKKADVGFGYGYLGLGRVVAGDASALVKIAAGAAIAGLAAFKGLNRADRNENVHLPQGATIPFIVGAAMVGALLASMFVYRDAVRKRRDAGQRIPLLARLYFANGWLSIPLWIVTVFVLLVAGILVFALVDLSGI